MWTNKNVIKVENYKGSECFMNLGDAMGSNEKQVGI